MCLIVVPACCMLMNVVIPNKLSGTTSRQRVLTAINWSEEKMGADCWNLIKGPSSLLYQLCFIIELAENDLSIL
jgi:hypothetical protein